MNLTSEDLSGAIAEMEIIRETLLSMINDISLDRRESNAIRWAFDQAWNELQALYAQRRALLDAAAREDGDND